MAKSTKTAQDDTAPAKRGRVSTFKEDVAEEICARIAEGEPLRQICREDGMPAWRTVYDWINANEDFAARIARARILGFDAIAEECLEIADTPRTGIKTKTGADGIEVTEEDMLGHRKLQIETRLKLLAKWSPRYSDRPVADPNPKGQDAIPREPEYVLKTDEPIPENPIL